MSNPLILLIYIFLTLALTHPLVFSLTAAVPSDIGDPLLNTWILAWDSRALLTNPLNLFNANIFYPLPHTLAFSEHLFSIALAALPLQLFSGEPIVAYNFSLLISFPLSAFGMYLLTLRWTHQRDAAFVAGLLFGFAPYRFAAIAHLQLLTFQWLPFLLLSIDIALARPAFKRYLVIAIFFLMQILASWYLAVYTGLIVGIYLLTAIAVCRVSPARFIKIIFILIIAALPALPFARPYLPLFDNLRAARPLSLALSLAAVPTDLAAAAPFNRLFGPLTETLRARPDFTEENMLFVGLVGPLLALAALWHWRQQKNRITRLSLGIILLTTLLLTLPGPYAALAAILPPSTVVRVPARWIIPAIFALTGLSGLGYATIKTRLKFQNYWLLPISLVIIAESFSAPIPLAPVKNQQTLAPVYHHLARQSANFALLELPLHSAPAPEYPEVKRLYASTQGWWPLVNGYSGYTPPRQPKLAQALTGFPDILAADALHELAQTAAPQSLLLLIHPGEAPFDRGQWDAAARWQVERNPLFFPLGEFAGDYLYRIKTNQTHTAAPLAVFGNDIKLRSVEPVNLPNGPAVILQWQSVAAVATDYTVFIHLRAADSFVLGQADGPPVSGHYPTTVWIPDELVQDIHPLPSGVWSQTNHLAIGLYHPGNGERLPAFGPEGQRLPDDTVIKQIGK
jgi:hypothetical protein